MTFHFPLSTLDFLSPWPGWLLVLVAAVSIPYVGWLYRRESGIESKLLARALTVVRILLLGLLVASLCEPVWVEERVQPGSRTVLLLVDESESMSLADVSSPDPKAAPMRRIEAVRRFLDGGRWVASLPGAPKVRIYGFSERTRFLGADSAEAAEAMGARTALGDALRSGLAEAAGHPVAAIFLFSDGRSNSGPDPVQAAELAAQRQIRVYAFGVGDPKGTRDARVAQFCANDVALVNDQVRFFGRVESSRCAGRSTQAVLLRDGEEVARQAVTLTDGPQELRFLHKADRIGRREYRLRIEPLAEEISVQNNEISLWIDVLDAKIKVLMVDGYPRWEFQYLRNAMKRDPVVAVSVLQEDADPSFFPEGTLPVRLMPQSVAEISAYDLVIVGDVSSGYLTESTQEALVRFVVDRAGGALFVAGSRHRSPQVFRDRPIEKILPVILFDPWEETQAYAAVSGSLTAQWQWKMTPEGRNGQIAQIGLSDEESASLWDRLPGFFWRSPVKRVKPLAATLLSGVGPGGAEDPVPLLVSQYAGWGRTALLATDETWRWRAGVDDLYFYRFWGALLRDLTRNRFYGRSRRFRLETGGRRHFEVGETIPLSAQLFDEAGQPVRWESVEVRSPLGEREPLRVQLARDPSLPGGFSGSVKPSEPGFYEFALWIDGRAEASAPCEVVAPRVEFEETSMDEALLKGIAERGKGAYRRLSDAAAGDLVRTEPIALTSRQEIPLWNHPLAFLFVVALLTLEWIARRMNRAL